MNAVLLDNTMENGAFIAHDIKNMLAVIRANVQLIQLNSDIRNDKNFNAVYNEIEKINGLIINGIAAGANSIDENRSNLPYIVEELFDKYEKLYDRNFILENKAGNTCINCKRHLIESMFENLIKNAIEATDEGGTITADIRIRQNKIIVTITDDGCGIKDSEIAKMSELFYTTKKGGSGVGLFMCRRIAEQNGGRLKISHNKPKGTKITVEMKTENK